MGEKEPQTLFFSVSERFLTHEAHRKRLLLDPE